MSRTLHQPARERHSRTGVRRRVVARVAWGAGLVAAMLAACSTGSLEEILADKACMQGRCADGYVCEQDRCIPIAAAGAGGGASEGGDSSGGSDDGGAGGDEVPPLLPIGTECAENEQCASGHCADGVCCDQACVGECVTCGQLGVYGTCLPRTGMSCGTDGACDSAGNCAAIDGATCTNVNDCSASPACADGVCCNEACDDSCESCAAAESGAADGVCAPAPEAFDECGGLGCMGQGQCCGEALPPTGSGCPSECTGGCSGGACLITCGADACNASNIVCPAGFDCRIECVGHHACKDAAIDCPPDHRCDVSCNNPSSDHACEKATLTCTNGPCAVTCTGDAPCKQMDIRCGTNACNASCVDQDDDFPAVECGSACACDATTCQ